MLLDKLACHEVDAATSIRQARRARAYRRRQCKTIYAMPDLAGPSMGVGI